MEHLLSRLPDAPGVYFFYAVGKALLYVGKATSLRSRVRSYFVGPRHLRPIEAMIHDVAKIRWKETDSALEAIILEANEIKKHQPKYNVEGKDDKSWNYIAITKDIFPKVQTIRQHELNNMRTTNCTDVRKNVRFVDSRIRHSHVFGPYPGLNAAATMKLLRKLFHFSTCQNMRTAKGATLQKPCLYYEMGQCLGVCVGKIKPKEYRAKVIHSLASFLSGRKKQLIKQLEIQMRKVAKAEDFEEAARLRNQIRSLQRIQDIALLNKSFIEHAEHANCEKCEIAKIEGYDISNLGPMGMVGSMVVFRDGAPDKSQYRKFKIRTVQGQSDVDCLEEVLRRRLKHTEWPYPQLFLIDGGKPQVNRAKAVLADLKLNIPMVGIAKGPDRKKNEIILGTKDRDVVRWIYANTRALIAVRDEAHRFAVKYQRSLRRI